MTGILRSRFVSLALACCILPVVHAAVQEKVTIAGQVVDEKGVPAGGRTQHP